MSTLIEIIRKAVTLPDLHVTGVCVAVDETKAVISVMPDDGGEEMPEVRLKALTDDSDLGIYTIPKIGSAVLLEFADGDRSLPICIMTLEVDKTVFKKASGFTVIIGEDDSVLLKGGQKAEISDFATISVECKEIVANCENLTVTATNTAEIKCTDAVIDASAGISLGKGGSGVVTEMSMPACFVTGAKIPCSMTVKAKM